MTTHRAGMMLSLLTIAAAGFLFTPAFGQEQDPCKDSLYLELKGKGLENMTEREYEIFKKKDSTCQEYQKASRTETTSGMLAGAQTAYYVVGALAFIVLLIILL